MASFAPLTAVAQLLFTLLVQPVALFVLAWAIWFLNRPGTRAYGRGILKAGACGWVVVFVVWTVLGVTSGLSGGYDWRGQFHPVYLVLTALLANAGFALAGGVVASWDYTERYEPPLSRV